MEKITAEQVKATLESQMESEEPDQILEILKKEAGKPMGKRLLAKLPGGADRWFWREIAGMTNLEDRDYRGNHGNKGISLLMGYDSRGPASVDPAWVEEHNPAYFSARKERNEKRRACMANPDTLQAMATALTVVTECRAALAGAENTLGLLTAYGASFSPDSCTWEKLGGKVRER